MKKQTSTNKWLNRYRSSLSKKNSGKKIVIFTTLIPLFSFFIIPFFVDYVFDYYVFRNWGGARLCYILTLLLICTAPLFNVPIPLGILNKKDGTPDMRLKENKRNISQKEASSYTKTKEVILFLYIAGGIIFSVIFMHDWLFYQQRLWGEQESKKPQIDYYDEDPAGEAVVPMVLDTVDENYIFENSELQELYLENQKRK